ncbi:ThiF family adenylyltransferase [Paenibacillus sp. IITD108]|uniref:ThiF family adenylyltransferase n=1 Tax=Paenibacillus sp. IITD108 TaxID=3116649 RepID=UPI002F3E599E
MPNGIDIKLPGKRISYQIVIVGLGANGSHFFRGLCQDVSTYFKSHWNKPFGLDVMIADGDRVEKKNLDNQLYTEEDIGEYKVVSLAQRYGDHYDIPIKRVTSYIKDMDMLKKMFSTLSINPEDQVVPVLIGMIDNVRP